VSGNNNVVLIAGDPALHRALGECAPVLDIELRGFESFPAAKDSGALDAADQVVAQIWSYSASETIPGIRAATTAPLLALIGPMIDCVDAIDAGADDFIRLPCPAREIAAKVRASLRRGTGHRADPALDFGQLQILRGPHEVLLEGKPVPMPRREFELLCFLAETPRRVFTREELVRFVWDASPEWLGPATVTEHVRRLRSRLRDGGSNHDWVVTVRGSGYRFEPEARDTITAMTGLAAPIAIAG
jgi:DNA-binding response OmpR family regulator